ncbi:MAG: hypothetical protein HUJ77_12300 [Clostridium sp.]|uniref:hypothetical protein n=1 Tax=Clostridium sp. TaxID=1506 RepID=UPI0025BF5DF5|nr:hypothetical protein [Clostridium sp.]MCF0149163.1 hypothetical protein [Clostridium sp.]
MSSDENRIIFNEIKSYEDAYYYNSDPSNRIKSNKIEKKIEKKKSNISEKVLEVIGVILEDGLEILFSFLD